MEQEFTQFYILEIMRSANGEFAHQVHWAWDADENLARLKAENKYHLILAAAALSEYATHSATLLNAIGDVISSQCYYHEVTEPEE